MSRTAVGVSLVLAIVVLMSGCGGERAGDGWMILIGPGPGPMWVSPPPPPANGVATAEARSAPMPTAPTPEAVQLGLLNLLQELEENPPADAAALQAALDRLVELVRANPNDPGAQLALALAIGVAGMFNMAMEAGMPPEEVFAAMPALLELLPAQHKSPRLDLCQLLLLPVRTMTNLYLSGSGLLSQPAGTKAVIPGFEEEGVSTEALQIGIRMHLLPALYAAIERVGALVNSASSPTEPILVDPSGETGWAIYPCDLKLLLALLHCLRSWLHELVAYQLNWGDYDWGMDLVARDANGDGVLTVAEYAPPDPFLWRHPAMNMQTAGDALRTALDCAAWAVENRAPGSLTTDLVEQTGRTSADVLAWVRDLRALLTGRANVRVEYEAAAPAAVSPAAVANVPLNLGAIYYDPADDLKDLLPTLHVVCDGEQCQAQVNGPDDFPDPTFHGVFPDPSAITGILAAQPTEVTISYQSIVIPLLSDGDWGVALP